MKELNCLRCGEKMQFLSQEKLQLGKTGWVLGDLPNLLAGALDVCILVCPCCKKLEFYYTNDDDIATDSLPQKICPNCGTEHDFDYPKCPKCKHDHFK